MKATRSGVRKSEELCICWASVDSVPYNPLVEFHGYRVQDIWYMVGAYFIVMNGVSLPVGRTAM